MNEEKSSIDRDELNRNVQVFYISYMGKRFTKYIFDQLIV